MSLVSGISGLTKITIIIVSCIAEDVYEYGDRENIWTKGRLIMRRLKESKLYISLLLRKKY